MGWAGDEFGKQGRGFSLNDVKDPDDIFKVANSLYQSFYPQIANLSGLIRKIAQSDALKPMELERSLNELSQFFGTPHTELIDHTHGLLRDRSPSDLGRAVEKIAIEAKDFALTASPRKMEDEKDFRLIGYYRLEPEARRANMHYIKKLKGIEDKKELVRKDIHEEITGTLFNRRYSGCSIETVSGLDWISINLCGGRKTAYHAKYLIKAFQDLSAYKNKGYSIKLAAQSLIQKRAIMGPSIETF